MNKHVWTPALGAVCALLLAAYGCGGSQAGVAPEVAVDEHLALGVPSDINPDRHLIGAWRWDLENGLSEPIPARTPADHYNVADALLMPEYAGALKVKRLLWGGGVFGPPAVHLRVTLTNIFGVTGWNVRGIVIDDSGLVNLADADGWTAQWDDGGDIPLNPYINFDPLPDWSFPDGAMAVREYILESPTGKLPSGVWFAVDAALGGPIQTATEFPSPGVNGVLRCPGDSSPMLCRLQDPFTNIKWVGAASKHLSGSYTPLADQGFHQGWREWTGVLNYNGELEQGDYTLYFASFSPLDIPTLSSTMVHIDEGPFATGPAPGICSQACYDAARTCRVNASFNHPLSDFVVKPPASSSGMVLTSDLCVVRRLEGNRSLALHSPGLDVPFWTRLVGDTGVSTAPAIGDEGTLFILEPEQGRLRAFRQDGRDRWVHEFGYQTHGDLILTSSPLGGLLITLLMEDGKDIALVAVGTDGHLRWRYNLSGTVSDSPEVHRIACGPNGTLYYTVPSGGVFALTLTGEPKWAVSQSGWESARDPVVGDDDRVFCLMNEGELVTCLTSTGGILWSKPMPYGERAVYPSLDYNGDLFTVVVEGDDTTAIHKRDGDIGDIIMSGDPGEGIRGYCVQGTSSDFVFVLRDPPEAPPGCGDDYFVCATTWGDEKWSIHTPGVTQDGAYPVVTPNGDIFVQGPDGMYIVIF